MESLFLLSDKPIADFYHYPEKITTLNPMVFVNLSTEGFVNWDFVMTFILMNGNQFIILIQQLGTMQLTLEDENVAQTHYEEFTVESELIFYLPTSFTPDETA